MFSSVCSFNFCDLKFAYKCRTLYAFVWIYVLVVLLNSVPVSRTLASLDCKIDGGSCSDGGGGALAASDCCCSGYMPSLISPDWRGNIFELYCIEKFACRWWWIITIGINFYTISILPTYLTPPPRAPPFVTRTCFVFIVECRSTFERVNYRVPT